MKNAFRLSFSLLALGLLSSCTADDGSSPEDVVLAKTITYTPELANFTTKTVGYYDSQNRKVLDSVFDGNLVFLRKIVTTYNSSQLTTAKTFNASNVMTKDYAEEYDTSGRLLTTTSYDGAGTITSKYTFGYDDINHTITKYIVNGSVSTAGFVYTLNSSGVLYYEENPSGDVRYIEFEGGKPSRLAFVDIDEASWPTYTYYPTIVPANMRVSTIERNNIALRIGLEHIVYNWEYYFSGSPNVDYQVQMTFNAANYPLTSKTVILPDLSLGERFYYY